MRRLAGAILLLTWAALATAQPFDSRTSGVSATLMRAMHDEASQDR